MPVEYLGDPTSGDGEVVEDFSHIPEILEKLGFKQLMAFKNGNTDNLVVGYGIATPTHSYAHEG